MIELHGKSIAETSFTGFELCILVFGLKGKRARNRRQKFSKRQKLSVYGSDCYMFSHIFVYNH